MTWGQIDPKTLLVYLPRLQRKQEKLLDENSDDAHLAEEHLKLLIDFLQLEYRTTLQKISASLSDSQITFDLIWAIFLPLNTVISSCLVTSEPRTYRVCDVRQMKQNNNHFQGSQRYWTVTCEYIEETSSMSNEDSDVPSEIDAGKIPIHRCTSSEKTFGWATTSLRIDEFKGTVAINKLCVYPIIWHPKPDRIKDILIARGGKWHSTPCVHHAQYNGMAHRHGLPRRSDGLPDNDCTDWKSHQISNRRISPSLDPSFEWRRYQVQGRIIIDRGKRQSHVCNHLSWNISDLETFGTSDPNYFLPRTTEKLNLPSHDNVTVEVCDDNLCHPKVDTVLVDFHLFASPILYGYDLTSKKWPTPLFSSMTKTADILVLWQLDSMSSISAKLSGITTYTKTLPSPTTSWSCYVVCFRFNQRINRMTLSKAKASDLSSIYLVHHLTTCFGNEQLILWKALLALVKHSLWKP